MTPADAKLRDQLKAVRDGLHEKRAERNAARKAREDAKRAFGEADFSANGDQKITDSPEFKDAEQAVRQLGLVEDAIADLETTEAAILRMLGDASASNGHAGNGSQPTFVRPGGGWDGHALLAQSDGYRGALEHGLFSSTGKFGTVEVGQITSREGFLAAALPTAAAGDVGTPADAVPPDFRGTIPPALKRLSLLDLIPTGTTDSNIVSFVQVTAIPGYAAETAELAAKPEEGLTLTDATAPVRTIAGYAKLARQAMDDVAGLATLINTLLPYDVRRRLELQILAGNGSGQNLNGILNTSGIGAPTIVGGDNVADAILRAMTTVVLSDSDPNFVTLNPLTWQTLLLMREGASDGSWRGEYLYGSPGMMQAPTIWGLRITSNRVVPQATPLVGDAMGAALLVREGVNIRVSDSDQDDFIKNRVTVLAETRVAFPVWRPSAFAKAAQG